MNVVDGTVVVCQFLGVVQESCPHFYTDIGELSVALDAYSLADVVEARSWATGKVSEAAHV